METGVKERNKDKLFWMFVVIVIKRNCSMSDPLISKQKDNKHKKSKEIVFFFSLLFSSSTNSMTHKKEENKK